MSWGGDVLNSATGQGPGPAPIKVGPISLPNPGNLDPIGIVPAAKGAATGYHSPDATPITTFDNVGAGGITGGAVKGAIQHGVGTIGHIITNASNGPQSGPSAPSTPTSVGSAIPGLPSLPGVGGSVGNIGWGSNFTPQNYVATAPNVVGADYSDMIGSGMSGVNSYYNRGQDVYGNQMANAGNALGTLPQYQSLYGQQGSLAGGQLGLAGTAAGIQGAQQGLYGQQQGLADVLMAQSRGEGPNPAQAQYQQNVNQNIAQQASAIASARGINPALAARMAAQQGAAMTQQAAGQSAIMQAQQQLAAQQQLQAQQQAMGQNLLGQGATLNTAGGLSGLAGQTYGNMGQNLTGQNNVYNTAGGLYGGAGNTAQGVGQLGANVLGTGVSGLHGYNQDTINSSLGAQGISATSQNSGNAILGNEAQEKTRLNAAVLGGVLNAGGALGAAAIKAPPVNVNPTVPAGSATSASTDVASTGGYGSPDAGSGSATGGNAEWGQDTGVALNDSGNNWIGGGQGGGTLWSKGGQIPDRNALSLAQALMGQGGSVPGKAKRKGDSPSNDTVPTVLSPKEIVLPRSVALAPDAPQKAADFVAKLKGKQSGQKGYGKILEKHRHLQKKMAELDAIMRKRA